MAKASQRNGAGNWVSLTTPKSTLTNLKLGPDQANPGLSCDLGRHAAKKVTGIRSLSLIKPQDMTWSSQQSSPSGFCTNKLSGAPRTISWWWWWKDTNEEIWTSVAMATSQHACTHAHTHFTHPGEMRLQPQQGGKGSLPASSDGAKAWCGWHMHFQSLPKCSLWYRGLVMEDQSDSSKSQSTKKKKIPTCKIGQKHQKLKVKLGS